MNPQSNTFPVLYRRERAAPLGSGRAEQSRPICRGKGEGHLEDEQNRRKKWVEKACWSIGLTKANICVPCPVPLPTSGSFTRPSWKEQELGS